MSLMAKVLLLLWILCCLPLGGFAAPVTADSDHNQPIEITAQQLEMLQMQRQAIFTGDVVVKQTEMTLHAKKLTIYLQQDQDQFERLEATGGVRVVHLDRIATAETAIYYQADERLVLNGNAEVVQGQNKISGDEITLYLQESRSVIKSSQTGRVKAFIIPSQEQKK
ncbi:MAG: lipopolysaccharide transport periplasmic protein LptA [Desulfuromonadales bacterium]|nr:lipopolysaccharide transport periplasmic protein LptA [Desulfuromonadales bacterium]